MPGSLDTLTEINLGDLIGAFGWQNKSTLAAGARWLFRRPARAFAQQMLDFDEQVGLHGLLEAARSTVRLHVRDIQVYGASNLPTGGYLALSNHPGLTDTLVLFAALGRRDLRSIAIARPFLLSLRNVSRQLFYVPEKVTERVGLIRAVAGHLRAGGAVLTFPAGHNEPDPDVYPGAEDALGSWVDSATVFARLAPGTPVVPVCVRGVAWRIVARNPFARLRRKPDDRQLLASALQLLVQLLFRARPITARVQIGHPVSIVGRGPESAAALHAAVIQQMRQLIQEGPQGHGQTAL